MCRNCVNHVTQALQTIPGVDSVIVDLPTNTATITGPADIKVVENAIEDLGYDVVNPSGPSKPPALQQPVAAATPPKVLNARISPKVELSHELKRGCFKVGGMTCASCVATIERHLRAKPGK